MANKTIATLAKDSQTLAANAGERFRLFIWRGLWGKGWGVDGCPDVGAAALRANTCRGLLTRRHPCKHLVPPPSPSLSHPGPQNWGLTEVSAMMDEKLGGLKTEMSAMMDEKLGGLKTYLGAR